MIWLLEPPGHFSTELALRLLNSFSAYVKHRFELLSLDLAFQGAASGTLPPWCALLLLLLLLLVIIIIISRIVMPTDPMAINHAFGKGSGIR